MNDKFSQELIRHTSVGPNEIWFSPGEKNAKTLYVTSIQSQSITTWSWSMMTLVTMWGRRFAIWKCRKCPHKSNKIDVKPKTKPAVERTDEAYRYWYHTTVCRVSWVVSLLFYNMILLWYYHNTTNYGDIVWCTEREEMI